MAGDTTDYYPVTDRDDEPLAISYRRQGLRSRLLKAVRAALAKFPHPDAKTPTNYVCCDETDTCLFIWVRKGETQFLFFHGDDSRVYDVPQDLRKGIPDKFLRPLVDAFVDCCEKQDGEKTRRRKNSTARKAAAAGAD